MLAKQDKRLEIIYSQSKFKLKEMKFQEDGL